MNFHPFRQYPQPPKRRPMSVEEHKFQADWIAEDPETADELIHELLVGMYPSRDCQNC
jgi:hypothetical protein